MSDFEHSTLWRISAFERARQGGGALDTGDLPTPLPTTMLADLRGLQSNADSDDLLEVMAACLRHREAALLYVAHGPYVWPLTLFPVPGLVHSPRDPKALVDSTSLSGLRLINAERPGVRPPGHVMHERVAGRDKYHLLAPLLWAIALYGPRATLLDEIGGRAAYRLMPGRTGDLPPAPGALAPALVRLRLQATSLREMAHWPGLSLERASRLLNAVYLHGGLMVARSHPAARGEPAAWRQVLHRLR